MFQHLSEQTELLLSQWLQNTVYVIRQNTGSRVFCHACTPKQVSNTDNVRQRCTHANKLRCAARKVSYERVFLTTRSSSENCFRANVALSWGVKRIQTRWTVPTHLQKLCTCVWALLPDIQSCHLWETTKKKSKVNLFSKNLQNLQK